jgi:hypothetical protein
MDALGGPLGLVLFLMLWVILQAVVLPRLGCDT